MRQRSQLSRRLSRVGVPAGREQVALHHVVTQGGRPPRTWAPSTSRASTFRGGAGREGSSALTAWAQSNTLRFCSHLIGQSVTRPMGHKEGLEAKSTGWHFPATSCCERGCGSLPQPGGTQGSWWGTCTPGRSETAAPWSGQVD